MIPLLDAAQLDDHSQIVRFVSIFIGDGFVGKVRAAAFMGVVLRAYAVLVQQKYWFSTAWEFKSDV